MNKDQCFNIFRSGALLFCLLGAVAGAGAQRSGFRGNLSNGNFLVGFKTFRYFDAARAARPAINYDGTAFSGERRRIVDIYLWYPGATGQKSAPMLYEDYLFAAPANLAKTLTEADKNLVRENFKRQNGGTENAAAVLRMPLEAVKDHPPASGKFPLIVGFSISRTLAEYLASHGYAVAVATSPTATDNQLADYVGDLEFAVNRLAENPQIDTARIGATGFSASAGVAALFQMKTASVAAIVSFDGTEAWNQWREQLMRESFFRPEAANVAYLRFNDLEHPAADVNFSYFYDRAQFMELIRIDYRTFGHRDMENAVFERLIQPGAAQPDYLQYQKLLGEYTLNFFDAQLKKSREAIDFLARPVEKNGFAADFAVINRRPALRRPPLRAEITEIIESQGVGEFLKINQTLKKHLPQPFPENLLRSLLLVYNRQRRHEIATALAELLVESYPELSTTYYFAGTAFKDGQKPAPAIKYFEKFLEIEKTDTVTPAATRERLRGLVVQNLQQLKNMN
jgi:hypothetical protein